jgi:hypothetical protein
MTMRTAPILAALCLSACGGSWTSADQASTADAVRLNLLADQMLDGGAARALERGAFCSEASILSRHGGSVPDASIRCTP